MEQPKCPITGRFMMKIESPEEFENAINAYLQKIENEVIPVSMAQGKITKPVLPTLAGLASYLDIDKDTLGAYGKRPIYDKIFQRFKAHAEDTILQRALSGEYQPAVSIFFLKNAFQYRDSFDINAVSSQPTYLPPVSKEEILEAISDDKIAGYLEDKNK